MGCRSKFLLDSSNNYENNNCAFEELKNFAGNATIMEHGDNMGLELMAVSMLFTGLDFYYSSFNTRFLLSLLCPELEGQELDKVAICLGIDIEHTMMGCNRPDIDINKSSLSNCKLRGEVVLKLREMISID